MQFNKANFTFLENLKENNNREWFAEHKPEYTAILDNVKLFYTNVKDHLEQQDSIEKLKLFRIYRDVRFSKDKTPYKTHFAGSFYREGKALRGGYYLHLAPSNKSFLAGGFWEPNKEDLFRIRKEFEIDDTEIRSILAEQKFVTYFGGKLEGAELKTAPKGFDKEHKAIDLIRKKGFVAMRYFNDNEVLANNFSNEVVDAFFALRPFFDYMSDVLTTNLNGESLL
ncbi:DUF2461 domain-containing protein [Tenacibaculum sp. SG-28]|uniref:DUF2461 domain-containing protein n=1 Tax=Tenacibaculum sp. SG-28 TaxID=754426 RepID=UPI000CF4FEB2|nr:DUF2461 domain-containing protein [Tenacibaculum sp. SG-28]PQJ23553.1 TIGR02453 family protein [Tenacibaculum sp. SG-28]